MRSALLLLYTGVTFAHPVHAQPGFLHGHGEWLLLAVAIAACVYWKIARK